MPEPVKPHNAAESSKEPIPRKGPIPKEEDAPIEPVKESKPQKESKPDESKRNAVQKFRTKTTRRRRHRCSVNFDDATVITIVRMLMSQNKLI